MRCSRADDEIFETVQPRRDGRRELILLEPVKFEDEAPETLYDDYSLYRMEEYVDAGTVLLNSQTALIVVDVLTSISGNS